MKSFGDLIKEVHQKGICQQCGGCVSFCNSIEHEVIGFKDPNGPPVYLNKDKCLKCALCYLICPQTHALEEEINRTYKFSDFTTMPLGFFFNIYSCQSTDKDFLRFGTDGGVVNTIIHLLLDKELIDGAIVAKTLGPFSREAIIAENKEDLIKASGIKLDIYPQLEEIQKFHTYTNSLPKLNQYRFKKICGHGCQKLYVGIGNRDDNITGGAAHTLFFLFLDDIIRQSFKSSQPTTGQHERVLVENNSCSSTGYDAPGVESFGSCSAGPYN